MRSSRYVSIKSFNKFSISLATSEFTFHYVSIKSHSSLYLHHCTLFNLHSTMYLLNHYDGRHDDGGQKNLHSTMYLLNLTVIDHCNYQLEFTFHYVSIKSAFCKGLRGFLPYLHSTMYLLNQKSKSLSSLTVYIYIPLCIY